MEIDQIPSAIESAAPQPLAPLTHKIISPQNIAAENRARDAQRLTLRQRWAVRSELKRVNKRLRRLQSQLASVIQYRDNMRPQMEELYSQYLELKARLADTPDDEELKQEYLDLWAEIAPTKARWENLNRQIEPYKRLEAQKNKLLRALEDHQIGLERIKTERRLQKAMAKEAQVYERLIIDKWTRLGFCERYTKGNKEYVKAVQFAEVHLTLDAIYFKIDASYQTAFKNWKTNIPQGVYIVEQLIAPKTLDELSIACQRQVTAAQSPSGAWVVVHRLDSVDGLMNYVSFDDVITRYPQRYNSRMPICVGVGGNREVQWINLSDFPHWLIGGFTNSGKSNMVNVGICTLITHQTPMDLRLILIDLKGGLEFNFYENVPHLHGQIVDSVSKVADTLEELEAMMGERFKKFRSAKAKRIEEYHAARPNDYMPRILCVFDEVASIVDHGETTKRAIASLRQLTAKGRAVGIHIWLCTQRPDVKVVEGAIKANLAVRLTGRLPSSADSVTILGNSMAKELAAIPGRMALQIGPDPLPVQTPHITETNIFESLSVAKNMAAPPPLELVPGNRIVHQEWTIERVIELSLNHLNGNLAASQVWQAADDLSKGQAQKLVEKIWAMEKIEFQGRFYRVHRGKGKVKTLVPIEEPEPIQEP